MRDTTYADSQLERHFLRVQPPHRRGEPWPAYFGIRPTLPDGRTPKIKIADAPRDRPRRGTRAGA
jgi:hypothetical protein